MTPAPSTTLPMESEKQQPPDRSVEADEAAQPIVNGVSKLSVADSSSAGSNHKEPLQPIADDVSKLSLDDSCSSSKPSKPDESSRPTADDVPDPSISVPPSSLEEPPRPHVHSTLATNDDPIKPVTPTIHLYAELLFNIQSITLFASLNSPSTLTRPTTASLYTNGSTLTIAHDNQSASITLPAPNIGKAEGELPMPAGRPKDVTLRLQVDGETARKVTEGSGGDGGGNLVPWGARDLAGADVKVGCRCCGVKLVGGGGDGNEAEGAAREGADGVKEWRDLPSESWADMMEFWHCHKPDLGDDVDGSHKNADVHEKGYAASNAIRAVRGVGLVDMSSFLLHEKDVLSIRENQLEQEAHDDDEDDVSSKTQSRLHCANCNNPIGIHDLKASGFRLFKWHLSITFPNSKPTPTPLPTPSPLHDLGLPPPSTPPDPQHHYSTEKWITAQLLSSTENNGTRKFLVHPLHDKDKVGTSSSSLLWLFTPDLLFFSSTSTSTAGGTPQTSSRACKILWKSVSKDEEKSTSTPTSDSNEEATTSHAQAQPDGNHPETKPPNISNDNIDNNATPTPSLEHLRQSPQTDEIDLPDPSTLIPALWAALHKSQDLLPGSMRIWQGWNVGLLRRFDGRDLGGGDVAGAEDVGREVNSEGADGNGVGGNESKNDGLDDDDGGDGIAEGRQTQANGAGNAPEGGAEAAQEKVGKEEEEEEEQKEVRGA
ncbi:MAG: hypothetical protein M1831_002839 [Alyxoria varia]|nr:MAG: hypothetical protein M1831_002839 [Alyxoria varia]